MDYKCITNSIRLYKKWEKVNVSAHIRICVLLGLTHIWSVDT